MRVWRDRGTRRGNDRADISQGIAASGRVDVVLNEFIGEHNRADGGVYEAACDADIDDEIGGISIDAELCCHGGVDFANATGTGDEVFAETIEIHASGGFCAFDSFIAKKRCDFFAHGIKKDNFHRCSKTPVSDEHDRANGSPERRVFITTHRKIRIFFGIRELCSLFIGDNEPNSALSSTRCLSPPDLLVASKARHRRKKVGRCMILSNRMMQLLGFGDI